MSEEIGASTAAPSNFRCGDHVRHWPSGEAWVVAWCDGDDLVPLGWPTTMAKTSDCWLARAASDAEHVALVREIARGADPERSSAVMRLYGGALKERPRPEPCGTVAKKTAGTSDAILLSKLKGVARRLPKSITISAGTDDGVGIRDLGTELVLLLQELARSPNGDGDQIDLLTGELSWSDSAARGFREALKRIAEGDITTICLSLDPPDWHSAFTQLQEIARLALRGGVTPVGLSTEETVAWVAGKINEALQGYIGKPLTDEIPAAMEKVLKRIFEPGRGISLFDVAPPPDGTGSPPANHVLFETREFTKTDGVIRLEMWPRSPKFMLWIGGECVWKGNGPAADEMARQAADPDIGNPNDTVAATEWRFIRLREALRMIQAFKCTGDAADDVETMRDLASNAIEDADGGEVRKKIGWARDQLELGERVQRAGWNGKGMFLIAVPQTSIVIQEGGPLARGLPAGLQTNLLSHVLMWTAQGELVPWLCSMTDFMADDWQLVERHAPGIQVRKVAKPVAELVEDKDAPGVYRVEAIDSDGGIEVTTFAGVGALNRAVIFAGTYYDNWGDPHGLAGI